MIVLPLKLITDQFSFDKKTKDNIEEVRQRLYDNLQPELYFDGRSPQQRVREAVLENKKEHNINYDTPRDVVWAKYLNRKKLHNNKYQLVESNYKPTKGTTNATYYKHPVLSSNTPQGEKKRNDFKQLLKQYVDRIDMGHNVVSNFELNDVFGDYTIGKGYDPEKGTYMSYFDLWDIAPLSIYGPDESRGIGNPVRFYDRVYLDDLYGADDNFEKKSIWLPNVTVSGKTKKHMKGGIMQYFKDGKNINRNNTQNNSTKKQNNLKNNRIKIDVPNPAPVDNTRWQPSTHVNYEKYKEQQGLQGLLNYFENNPPSSITPFWHHDKKKKWYEGFFDWIDYFKNGKKIHIKESQKGSFTKYCGGNVTSECIARGKASPDPRIRKKATFADNARKWKHQWGGMLHKPEVEDESTEYGPEYWANIKIDPDSLNPYGAYKFGLPAYNDKWYVGDKAGDSQLTFVNNLYNELQSNIRTAYPEYSSSQIDNLADFMVRHYVKENGWRKVNRLVGGYGKATSTQQWINGMKKMYPNAMKANTFEQYVNGLKANIQGNKYNSVNPNYFNELYKQFGGDKVRIGRYLKQIRDTK